MKVSLVEYLEKTHLKKFHFVLLAVFMLGWAFDAMNSGLISFVLTPLIEDLGLSSEVAGFLLSAWLYGMFLGAALIGTLADYLGRKTAGILSIVLYSIPAGLSGFASTWRQIFVLRFLAGMGASSYMAVTSTFLSEYIPTKHRGRLVAFLESAWAFGWLIASYFGLILAPTYGWQNVLLMGFLPVVVVPFFFLMPESIRYLKEKGSIKEAISILKKSHLIPEKITGKDVALKKTEEIKVTIRELFLPEYRKRTIMIWIHWFCIVFAYWGIFLWLPHILTERGLSLAESLNYSFLITLMQIPGYWSGAYLLEKLGRKFSLVGFMLIAGIGSYLLATATTGFEVLVFGSLISFFNLGAWGITYAYTPELYPTRSRATGAGWANSVGRIGGIIGPTAVGYLLALFGNQYYIFLLFALMHVISAVVVGIFGIETKGKKLEEI